MPDDLLWQDSKMFSHSTLTEGTFILSFCKKKGKDIRNEKNNQTNFHNFTRIRLCGSARFL